MVSSPEFQQQNSAAEIIESEKVYGNQNKQPFYHMEERTGCLAIGLQPVFKRSCISLHISV
jgi:hypothetical protein